MLMRSFVDQCLDHKKYVIAPVQHNQNQIMMIKINEVLQLIQVKQQHRRLSTRSQAK